MGLLTIQQAKGINSEIITNVKKEDKNAKK